MGFVRVACAIVVALSLAAVGEAAAPPRDRKPPSTPRVDGNSETTDLRPVFHFSAHDDRTPPTQLRFRCAIDSPTLRTCSHISRPSAALAFGKHLLRVRAVDRAGNSSRVATYPFTVIGTWDAAADFARAPNPENPGRDRYGNATWFYLYSGTTAHDPSDYHALSQFQALDPNIELWYSVPGPFANTGVWVGWSYGRITIGPGYPNLRQNAIVGWRSPVTSSISLAATILQNQNTCTVPQNGILWSIDQGASTLRSGRLAPGETARVDLTTSVTAGEALYLVVDANGDSSCDGTLADLVLQTR
jgi:hypothetical protein